MISVSRLLCDEQNFGDSLRYTPLSRGAIHGAARGMGPVVVWNCTRSCNLKCIHCYAVAGNKKYEGELTTEEARSFIESLHAFKVPVLLISGGEPLMREDILHLARYAGQMGIRTTFSTNGTLIKMETARQLKDIGVSYVGISLDGLGDNNDRFRGYKGAFDLAVQGIENCLAVGQKVGLRFTINKHNISQIQSVFNFVEEMNIPRICFYHLVYSGRGSLMVQDDLTHEEARAVMDLIIENTLDFSRKGLEKEVLTVDNNADGVYIYQKLLQRDPVQASRALELLKINGGNRSGIAIGCVDWLGNVHPDQFTQNHTFGNIKDKSFPQIWMEQDHPILQGLRRRKELLKGRCSSCRWLEVCNGNFRARAEAVTGDFWDSDPACYLTENEIS